METLAATAAAGSTAERKVFDSENTWEQQKTLVRDEGGKVTGDEAVDTVYDYAGVVRKYFKRLERNSIDNQGMDLIFNVHFGTNYMNGYLRA